MGGGFGVDPEPSVPNIYECLDHHLRHAALVVFPGAGSELCRRLGNVNVGGIAISPIFTVFVIPSILMFAIKKEKKQPGNQWSF